MTKCRIGNLAYASLSLSRLKRRRQGYSQSRRSREFPSGAHARRFSVFSISFVSRSAFLLRGIVRRLTALRAAVEPEGVALRHC